MHLPSNSRFPVVLFVEHRGRPVQVPERVADPVGQLVGAIADGAPTIPTVGPCGYYASSVALTNVGLADCPVISRALVRFNAGCRRPSTST